MNEQAAREVVLIYTTWPDAGQAAAAGRALVAEHLAACVNIGPPVTSIYTWAGAIEQGVECPMLIKTTADRTDAVVAAVTRLHPHELPAIVALPASGGHAGFLQWIAAQTAPEPPAGTN